MENKYLWIFVPFFNNPPFPLFWSDKNLGMSNVEDLDEEMQEKIKYLFSDSDKNYTEGYVASWSHLHLLDHESVLPPMP